MVSRAVLAAVSTTAARDGDQQETFRRTKVCLFQAEA